MSHKKMPDTRPEPMRTLLLTNENSAMRIIKALRTSTRIIVGLIISDPAKQHPLQKTLDEAKLDYWLFNSLKDGGLASRMRSADIDLLLTFRFPRIVPTSVIDVPRLGAFNLHTGPLPAYAGMNVASWAIFNGETEHGVTLHRLAAGIDTGDVVMAERFPVDADETGVSLTSKCVRVGSRLMSDFAKRLMCGEIPKAIPQELEQRRYYSKEVPGEGRIDWQWGAVRLERLIRASYFYPFPSPWGVPQATLSNTEFGILRAETVSGHGAIPGTLLGSSDCHLDVATSDGTLRIREVTWNGALTGVGLLAQEILEQPTFE